MKSFLQKSPQALGKEFFSEPYNKKRTQEFLNYFLVNSDFDGLFDAMRHGHAKVEYGAKSFITNSLGINDLDSSFFNLFIELCSIAGLGDTASFSVAVASFNAVDEKIAAWKMVAKSYILVKAQKDFMSVANLLKKLDLSFKSFAILFEVDKKLAAKFLLNELLYTKNIDKSAIRKMLVAYKVDIDYMFGDSFKDNDTKTREAIVRLALLYKNEQKVIDFLSVVASTDPNKLIRELASIDSQSTKHKVFSSAVDELEFYIKTGKSYLAVDFKQRLENDVEFKTLAQSLFFCVFNANILQDVVVVQNEKVCNLDNNAVLVLDSYTIKVLHPIEIPPSYGYIKTLKIPKQPIVQIDRPCFIADNNELRTNMLNRLPDTILSVENFERAVKKYGFRFLYGKNDTSLEFVASFLAGFACVLNFSTQGLYSDNQIVTLKSAKFYKDSDLVKIKGRQYLEGATPIAISSVPPRIFSELVYAILKLGGACK